MLTPIVTVIIPTFDRSGVLPFAIGSVLRQSFVDFELLVIGDACTDDSAEVVSAVQDDRVTWINLPKHAGHQSGPNTEGLRRARGRFVAYLGHDDLWLPHHLEVLVAALERGADLAYGVAALIGQSGAVTPAPVPAHYVRGLWIPPSAVVHRREIAERVGGWRHARDRALDAEADLWRRVFDAGLRIEAVPRLTALKLPALWRRDVYRERPYHEQAQWWDRVATEPDLEAALLGRMLTDAVDQSSSAAGLIRNLGAVAFTGFRVQLLRWAPGLYRLVKNRQRRRHRAFKGLPGQV